MNTIQIPLKGGPMDGLAFTIADGEAVPREVLYGATPRGGPRYLLVDADGSDRHYEWKVPE